MCVSVGPRARERECERVRVGRDVPLLRRASLGQEEC